ncbi:ABC transporter permease [Tessaracoccus sp. HDW20]|uniref:ABC transporter permease n=1 Tax=Tessaracoccus coleopterorum TaxID=2714950 RepID=UPI0018D279D2|nr:ABC transporter permease [Tessaracoccus coleopterorum]NHB84541.1 ABC transporter permease [Tessaracoccus coleopterorum]
MLILVFILLSFFAPNFLTAGNLLNVLQQAAFFGIVAFAMTLVIVSGEIDVSVGSQAALTSSLVGYMVGMMGWNMAVACLVAIVVAVFFGAFVGFIRHVFNVPTFIGTLALYLALRGAAMLITNTFPIPLDPSVFFYWAAAGFSASRWRRSTS